MRESLALFVLVSLSFSVGFWGSRLGEASIASMQGPVAPLQELPDLRQDTVSDLGDSARSSLVEEMAVMPTLDQQIHFLRSAGFPDDGIFILLSGAAAGSEQSERFWMPVDFPWWKSWQGPPQLTPQELESWQKPYRDLEDKMGAAGLTEFDRREAAKRFGVTDPQKIFRLKEIRADYNSIENRIRAMPEAEQGAAYQLMDAERSRDIRAILTAEQFATYEFRTSPGIRSLEHQLRGIEFTVDEFEALIPTWSQHSPEVRRFETDKRSAQDERLAELLVDEQVRETLGETRFWDYKVGNDSTFKLLAAFVEQHELPRGQVLSLWDEYVAMEAGDSPDRKSLLQARVNEVWGNVLFEKAREYGRLSWLVGSSEGGDG